MQPEEPIETPHLLHPSVSEAPSKGQMIRQDAIHEETQLHFAVTPRFEERNAVEQRDSGIADLAPRRQFVQLRFAAQRRKGSIAGTRPGEIHAPESVTPS